MQRLSINRFNFEVFTTHKANIISLEQLGIKAVTIKLSIIDQFLAIFAQNTIWQVVQRKLKLIGPLENKLLQHGCDVVYYVTPGYLCSGMQKLNYINTVWDLCHRETPEFPEVRSFNTFFIRDNYYKFNFGPALATLTDSTHLADMAAQFYGIDRNRFITMPFSPAPFLDRKHAASNDKVFYKYKIDAGYFYYPAQFWAHKNHIRILQALKILRDEKLWLPTVVFSGRDYGNLAHIKKYIQDNKLESQVKILGFVPSEDMRALYENAMAVVMPTYFGPTNLPPLEAWLLNVPLIYSVQFTEQVGNAALLVDPDSATELASAMQLCAKHEIRERLVIAGQQRITDIEQQRINAEASLCLLLEKFAVRRQCWE